MKSYYDLGLFKKTIDIEKLSRDEIFNLSCKFIVKDFELNNANAEFYKQLKFYFDNDKNCNYNRAKGLLLVGSYGTGKTAAMEIVHLYCLILEVRTGFRFLSSDFIIDSFIKNGRPFLNGLDYSENILIDELGEDTGKHCSFGSIDDPVEVLLAKRYNKFISYGYKTHATSNLDVNSLQKRFSGKIYDRICEMFTVVPLTGESWRRKSII